MLLKGLFILPLILCFFSTYAAAGPTFLVTTPLDIRPGLNLTLGIEMLADSPSAVTVEAEILKDNITLLKGEGMFNKGSFGTLVLPKLPLNSVDGKYELHVKGFFESQIIFSKKTSLEFKSKTFSVLIETNSVLYKPGQEVKIRILAFSAELKPYKSTVDIHILDPYGNLIEQWLEEEAELGVVSKSFYLSNIPPLGDWTIKVKLHHQVHYQSFTVVDYVLPRFEVLLSTPLHHSVKNEIFEGSVTAKYTYGMPVKGILAITLLHRSIYKRKTNITKTFEINGYSKFNFSNLELQELMGNANLDSDIFTGPVDIIADVKESLTGISQNQTSSIHIINYEYYSEFYDYPSVLKPMLNFATYLKILRYDGNELTAEERRNNVNVTITQLTTFTYVEPSVEVYSVPENGIILIEVPLQANITRLNIKAEFLDSVNHLYINDIYYSPNSTYIEIKESNQDIEVGMPFNLTVNSNTPLKEISYLVVSRGQIVAVGKETSMTVTLNPEHTWTPEACVIVYHVANDGMVISDVTTIYIQLSFKNKILISWNKTQAAPSEKVSLAIRVTEPNSLVGISAVDKSVKLLGDQQEISTTRVLKELSDFSTSNLGQITNPGDVFQKCNIGVITDATVGNLAEEEDRFWYEFETSIGSNTEDMPRLSLPDNFINPRIRSIFPETWIWKHIKTGSRTDMALEVQVPDTITSWITSAFVISENLGLGMMTAPIQLEAFQPFFISLKLPSYVTRGEQFILEVIVFNYLNEDTEVSVKLDQSDTFDIQLEFVNATGADQTIFVPSQEGKTVLFPINPIQLGEIPITVKAISSLASDAITQKLLVQPEGIEQSYSQTLLLELTTNQPQPISKPMKFTFPPDVVSGSEKAFITVVGDIIGPSLSNIESLIQLPSGCGEQNMILFAPNIFIMEYLTNTKQLNDEIAPKLITFMKEGYQRELTFQRKDGSFSAFGNDDTSGSTWLSAFVLRCFLKARKFILVDPVVLHNTLTWLLKHQRKNGEFWEPGRVIHAALQGGHNSPVTLTAYIMAALIEYPGIKNSDQIEAATEYLESQMNYIISDNYTLSLVTYALSLVGRSKAKEGLDILNKRAEHDGQQRFWKSPSPKVSGWWQPSSSDVEMVSYALLSHIIQNRVAEGIAVMRWLSQQRNHLGGYSSTQDTIVALQALSSFASMYNINKTAARITVDGSDLNISETFSINANNRILLQSKNIAVGQPIEFTVYAAGVGLAILQLHVIYNIRSLDSSINTKSISGHDAFDLGITVRDDTENVNAVALNICTRYLIKDPSAQSGMAVMQVDLLSGFSLSPEGVLIKYPIKKVESSDGKVHVYFDSLNETQVCVDIPATRDFKVGYTQDAFVNVLDYYEPRRRAERSYNSKVMQKLSPCSFCKDDCSTCITENSSFGFQHHAAVLCLLIILLALQITLL
ncbi:CD109 antigen-like [Rhinophrynus dorsalis]